MGGRACTGLMWFRLRTGGEHFWTRSWTFDFHKMLGVSWLPEELRTFQEGLCSKAIVSARLSVRLLTAMQLKCSLLLDIALYGTPLTDCRLALSNIALYGTPLTDCRLALSNIPEERRTHIFFFQNIIKWGKKTLHFFISSLAKYIEYTLPREPVFCLNFCCPHSSRRV